MSKTTLAHKPGYLDSHKEEILKMLNDNMSRKEVAAHFNVTDHVFYKWMQKKNIQQMSDGIEIKYVFGETDNMYEQNKEKILKWYRDKISHQEIADRLGAKNANPLGQYLRQWKREID